MKTVLMPGTFDVLDIGHVRVPAGASELRNRYRAVLAAGALGLPPSDWPTGHPERTATGNAHTLRRVDGVFLEASLQVKDEHKDLFATHKPLHRARLSAPGGQLGPREAHPRETRA